jgi:hypothetical protein
MTLPTNHRRDASAMITATLTFSKSGYLRGVLLNAENLGDEEVLEGAINRLLKPAHVSWVRRLFKRS